MSSDQAEAAVDAVADVDDPVEEIINPDVEAREGKYYAQLSEDGTEMLQVSSLPQVGVLPDGSQVSGFDKLDDETLKSAGWVPVDDPGQPEYDPEVHELTRNFEVDGDKVVVNYELSNVPLPEPVPPTADEQLSDLLDLLVKKNVISQGDIQSLRASRVPKKPQ